MKKVLVIISVVLAIIIVLIVAASVALDSFRAFLMGEPDVIQEVVSPDGKYVAYVFESNGGATTRFTYRLSVLKNGKELKAGDIGNTFITYDEFDVGWVDNDTLKVNNIASTYIFKQETKIGDVSVSYNYIKE